ncbi:pitrilysin family protein [Telmatospirillum sp.]|uniref:M16 family metallopeptidase n=1 Tax=Telmatospirillum sp. TaxID=2079197 RepID=UPI00284E90E1|nr:pitrilysin family protein [Telmatospirillum sp.]MDR3435898.1 pitrilysin family protein [Telmatospirillum sp.]
MQAFSRVLATVAIVAGLSIAAPPAWAQVFNPDSFTLKNGMQVVVIPNHRTPVVSHMVYYKVGSADEVAGKTGLAHMLEHMMFKGTKAVPAGSFSQLVASNGGRENAFTTADYTGFYQNVAVDKLPLVMKLEADRMVNLALQDKDFQPERQVVLEERRMRIENEPQALLEEQLQAALFLNSPYHHPVIGWRNEIEKYVLQDVVDFYRRWYAPNNAILVISGDVTAAQVKPLAEKYYGVLRARPVPERLRTEEPAPIAARTVEMRDPDVHQPVWERLYLAPSYRVGDTKYAYPLQVLSEILGGGATSRLYKSLVVDQNIAAEVAAAYEPDRLGQTSFDFEASPRPGVTVEALQKALVTEIQNVANKGVTAQEVEQAKQRLQTAVIYARDSYHTGGRVLGAALGSGRSIADEEAWPSRISAVTSDEVSEAARQILRDERSVTGLLLPASGDEATTQAVTAEPAQRLAPGMSGRELR